MGAKFIADRRCSVKTSLTLTGLIEALKHRSLLQRITGMVAAGVIPDCDADSRLDLILMPEPGLPGDLTLRDLHDQAAGLYDHRITCRQCPSSLHGHVGECIVYVPYPISEGMEFLLWHTAVRALRGELPEGLLPRAQAFARHAQSLRETPFTDSLRSRGDLAGTRARQYVGGLIFRRERLSSAQVLDAFFVNGTLGGDALRVHEGFLAAVLAVARPLEQTLTEERRQAMQEDLEAYQAVHLLISRSLEQGVGVYIWP